MSARSEALRQLAESFLAVHQAWQDAGDDRPTPDETYWDHVDALTEGFATGDIPSDCRALNSAVATLTDETVLFDLRTNLDNHLPHRGFFRAVEGLQAVLVAEEPNEETLPPLESFESLVRDNVPPHQICRIYGFMDKQGREELWKVADETKNPGKWTDPAKGWIDPRIAKMRAERQAAETNAREVSARRAPRPAKKACEESTKQLLLEGVDDRQIARMKGLPESTIAAFRNRFTAGEEIPDEPEAEAPSDVSTADADALEARVLELAGEGFTAKEIADEVQTDGRTVSAIMRRAKKSEEQAA